MTTSAVVVAAGAGSRLGGEPKQFRALGGRPLLAWSCSLFASHPEVESLVVVLPPEMAASPPEWLVPYCAKVIVGGATRQESVQRGLAGVRGSDLVLIHDAARPFASAGLVSRLLVEARIHGSVIPVLEVADAIKQVDVPTAESKIERTLDRSLLRAAQTPQVFPLDLIRRIHTLAEESGLNGPDDAALCEAAGVDVRAIIGERWAFKITQAEDFALAEWLVASGMVRLQNGT